MPISKKLAVPTLVFGLSGLGIWYYMFNTNMKSQKHGNTLFKGIMFHLRQQPHVVETLGAPIKFDEHKAIKGDVNMIKGAADIEFVVSGSKSPAIVHFKGHRVNQGHQWESTDFSLITDDGRKIEL